MYLLTLVALVVVAAAIFCTPVKFKSRIAFLLVVAGSLLPVAKAVEVLFLKSGQTLLWQGMSPIWGIERASIDPLSALFILIIAVAGMATTLYASGYLKHYEHSKSPAHFSLHLVALVTLVFSMMGVVCASGGFLFLFFWELMTIASFILILFDAQRKEVAKAALNYLVMMHIGFILLVAGFVKLWAVTGSADFSSLVEYYSNAKAMPLFVIFLLGFGMKAGLFPMHIWLPEAHPAAPSHVSAIMSGVMIKTGVYGVLRVVAPISGEPLYTIAICILAVGIVTGLWGVILAATQNDVKRLMAYSSIENIGVIFIALGIALLGRYSGNESVALCGMCGALLHTLNHSLFKSLLFFGAGNVYSQTHTTSLDKLGGVAKSMPMTAILFLIAAMAISALPPLNGFVSEWFIYVGLLNNVATNSEVVASATALVAMAMIGGLVVLAFTKLYGTVFLGSPRSHEVAEAQEVDNLRIAGMALPLMGIFVVGFWPEGALKLISRAAAPLFGYSTLNLEQIAEQTFCQSLGTISLTAVILVSIVAIVWWLKSRILKSRVVSQGPTWGCGFTAPNTKMQYTGESFSEGLQSIADTITSDVGHNDVEHEEIFPTKHTFDIGHKDKIDSLFQAWWVELIRRINGYVMRLRTGKINHYILFALAFLVLIFIFSILNWI